MYRSQSLVGLTIAGLPHSEVQRLPLGFRDLTVTGP